MSVTGSILTAFGFILSIFATDVYYLYFSFGILGGELHLQVCLLFFAFFISGLALLDYSPPFSLYLPFCIFLFLLTASLSPYCSLFGYCCSISYSVFLILNSCFLTFNFPLFFLGQHSILTHFLTISSSLIVLLFLSFYFQLHSIDFYFLSISQWLLM